MVDQFVRRRGIACPIEIFATRDQITSEDADSLADDVGHGRDLTKANSDVDSLADQIDKGIAKFDVQLQLGIFFQEHREGRCDQPGSECDGHGHA